MTGLKRNLPIAIVLAVGWATRLHEFLLNRSLSWYEAALATNILHKPLAALVGPLDNHEAAAFGYLLLSRAAVAILGDGERALRLVPLVCGLASLPLLYIVAKRYLAPWLAVAVVALFAIAPAQILWANTVKGYATDLVVALVLLWAADWLTSSTTSAWRAAAVGAAAVWCSLSACFVLAGIWLAAAIDVAAARAWRRFARLAGAAAVWTVSFAVYYVVSLRHSEADAYLRHLWVDYFLSVRDLEQTRELLALTFVDPLNIVAASAWPIVPVVVAGVAALWRMPRRRAAELVVTPACVAAASCVGFYPWADRMLLFVTPLLVILLVAGAAEIGAWVGRRRATVAVAVTTVLIALFGARSVKWTWTPIDRWDETRPLVAYIAEHLQPGDRIFAAEYSAVYEYYKDRYGLGAVPYTIGPYYDDEQGSYDCRTSPRPEPGARWWVLTDRLDVRACFKPLGAPRTIVTAEDAGLYLYSR